MSEYRLESALWTLEAPDHSVTMRELRALDTVYLSVARADACHERLTRSRKSAPTLEAVSQHELVVHVRFDELIREELECRGQQTIVEVGEHQIELSPCRCIVPLHQHAFMRSTAQGKMLPGTQRKMLPGKIGGTVPLILRYYSSMIWFSGPWRRAHFVSTPGTQLRAAQLYAVRW